MERPWCVCAWFVGKGMLRTWERLFKPLPVSLQASLGLLPKAGPNDQDDPTHSWSLWLWSSESAKEVSMGGKVGLTLAVSPGSPVQCGSWEAWGWVYVSPHTYTHSARSECMQGRGFYASRVPRLPSTVWKLRSLGMSLRFTTYVCTHTVLVVGL